MPITLSAKKKVRVDQKRRTFNLIVRHRYKQAVKQAVKEKNKESLRRAYQELDMAAKKRVIHPNKAARLKSRLTKMISTKKLSQNQEKVKTGRLKKKK